MENPVEDEEAAEMQEERYRKLFLINSLKLYHFLGHNIYFTSSTAAHTAANGTSTTTKKR